MEDTSSSASASYSSISLRNSTSVYIDEDSIPLILTEQKKDLSDKIKGIYDDLQSKITIYHLGSEQNDKNELESYNQFQNKEYLEANKLLGLVIFFGVLIFATHLVSVYEINGIISAIEEELIATIKSYLKMEKREANDDFYQNFNKLNAKLPDYSVFFISSFLYQCLDESLGYALLTIFILILNFLILFFGFKDYEFNVERNNYKNYSFSQFIHLYIIYLFLCIFEGIIALLPLKIIKEGFIYYENYKNYINKLKNDKNNKIGINSKEYKNYNNTSENIISDIELNKKERNNNIQHNNIQKNNNIQNNNLQNNNLQNNNILKNKEKEDNNIENKDKLGKSSSGMNKEDNSKIKIMLKRPIKLQGYLPFYLISISCSIILKLFLDKVYINEYNYNSRKNVNYYLIISYCISTCLSLLFYLLFWRYIIKKK